MEEKWIVCIKVCDIEIAKMRDYVFVHLLNTHTHATYNCFHAFAIWQTLTNNVSRIPRSFFFSTDKSMW